MNVVSEYLALIDDLSHLIEEESLFYFPPGEDAGGAVFPESCAGCPIKSDQNVYVPGVGSPDPSILVVGDVPGSQPESRSRSFNLEAGSLLTRMLAAMKLSKDKVFITTYYKCYKDKYESTCCRDIFDRQLDKLGPDVILALGGKTISRIMGSEDSIENYRGKAMTYRNIPVYASYHPEDLIKNPELKGSAWQDLRKIMEVCGK